MCSARIASVRPASAAHSLQLADRSKSWASKAPPSLLPEASEELYPAVALKSVGIGGDRTVIIVADRNVVTAGVGAPIKNGPCTGTVKYRLFANKVLTAKSRTVSCSHRERCHRTTRR